MKIYTKSGDQGKTSLLGGQRVDKNNRRIELLGTLDELNSVLGLALSAPTSQSAGHLLERTQRQLFAVGAELARPDLAPSRLFEKATDWTGQLEREIDQHVERLPPLANFILPGGSPAAAAIHLARSVCRRAERIFFAEPVPDGQWVGVYLNRLGDWLFVLARLVNQADHQAEAIWIAGVE